MEGDDDVDEEVLSSACALPLPHENENEDSDSESWMQEDSEIEEYLVFDETTQICVACDQVLENPSYGPLCNDCHAFLYPDFTELQRELDEERSKQQEDERQRARSGNMLPVVNPSCQCVQIPKMRSECRGNASETVNKRSLMCEQCCSGSTCCWSDSTTDDGLLGLALLSLYDKDWIHYNTKCFKDEESVIEDDLVENMPTEILVIIFSYLDEIGLCKASQVCRRWMMLASGMENWSVLFEKRWPLFRPVGVVNCWRALYVRMIEATTCVPCFEQGFVKRIPVDDVVNSWRNKRLRSELKQLLVDPPHGIRACPVDDEYSHWQASIEGPPDSVYENGIFYVHLELPRSYPMRPPIVRFLTRILHPNVNRHGNVGMDCLRHNWSLALTIPKILVSVQSLLTDPYCHLPMEPVVARMYNTDADHYDMLARDWTRKFAMHHFQSDLSPWQD